MQATQYRPGLPPLPLALRARPVARGYPVPWFVAQQPDGSYDFRVADGSKFAVALREERCWICGSKVGRTKTFVLGPMCAVNRTCPEPPSHRECAHWSALACPFLNQQERHRREGGLPDAAVAPPAGEMIARQPGVTLVWETKSFTLFGDGRGGVLITVGEPVATAWYTHGREATRAEVMASIESGLPALQQRAEQDGPAAIAALKQHLAIALNYVPQS
jgi:hypothetical protein